MQISQMFKRKPCVFSIECFPPKQTANFGKMKDTLRTMRTLNPDFISVMHRKYQADTSSGDRKNMRCTRLPTRRYNRIR